MTQRGAKVSFERRDPHGVPEHPAGVPGPLPGRGIVLDLPAPGPRAWRVPVPHCGHRRSHTLAERGLEQCATLRYQASLTAGRSSTVRGCPCGCSSWRSSSWAARRARRPPRAAPPPRPAPAAHRAAGGRRTPPRQSLFAQRLRVLVAERMSAARGLKSCICFLAPDVIVAAGREPGTVRVSQSLGRFGAERIPGS